jgi:hypothetical protein
VSSELTPCRDCATPTIASARACPQCGILNPVLQWVSYPDGSHMTARQPTGNSMAYAMGSAGGGSATAFATVPSRASYGVSSSPGRVRFGAIAAPAARGDRLADWAIWCTLFVVLSTFLVGGAIGGLIAAAITYPIRQSLPVGRDGRQLPPALSWSMIGGSAAVFLAVNVLYGMMMAAKPH